MIRIATENDISVINKLANEIWWPAYGKILSPEQIGFMLEKIYSPESLRLQMAEGNTFLLVEKEHFAVAFASFSCTEPEEGTFKLHKLYIHPSEQGRGTGRCLISEVENMARDKGGKTLELNVNRHNPAFHFYKKQGFSVHSEADIPFYQFFMNDYIMRKPL